MAPSPSIGRVIQAVRGEVQIPDTNLSSPPLPTPLGQAFDVPEGRLQVFAAIAEVLPAPGATDVGIGCYFRAWSGMSDATVAGGPLWTGGDTSMPLQVRGETEDGWTKVVLDAQVASGLASGYVSGEGAEVALFAYSLNGTSYVPGSLVRNAKLIVAVLS